VKLVFSSGRHDGAAAVLDEADRAMRHVLRRGISSEPTTGVPPVRVPDYAEPLLAWRLWEIEAVDGAPRLRSLYRLCFWPVGQPLEARCHAHRFRLRPRSRHAAPSAMCTCGIYAVRFERIPKLSLDGGLQRGRSLVIGSVSLWGDVVECERGWRAALAYPTGLFVPRVCRDAEETAAGLEDYNVPVELIDADTLADALDAVAGLTA